MKKQEANYSEVKKRLFLDQERTPLSHGERCSLPEQNGGNFYQRLFETAIDAILICDLDGLIVEVNRRAELLLDYPRQDLLGSHYSKVFSSLTASFLIHKFIPSLLFSDPVNAETEIVRGDESRIPVEVCATLIGCDSEQTQYVQIVVRDLTQKKNSARQRTDFLEMLAHDIRSPLSVVVGYADLLVNIWKEQATRDDLDMLFNLRNGAFSLANLVLNYLDVAKIETRSLVLAKTQVAVNEVLRRVGRQYEQEAQRLCVDLEVALCTDLPLIIGDRLAIERIITNLLHNALKFTPAKGQVTLRSQLSQDGGVTIAVADTGPGMTTEELAIVFEKYRTAKKDRKKEGSGLGLFIVQALVEGHGGRIVVDSTPGVGTCISVVLPVLANCESETAEKW